jgi:hypothetical protein
MTEFLGWDLSLQPIWDEAMASLGWVGKLLGGGASDGLGDQLGQNENSFTGQTGSIDPFTGGWNTDPFSLGMEPEFIPLGAGGGTNASSGGGRFGDHFTNAADGVPNADIADTGEVDNPFAAPRNDTSQLQASNGSGTTKILVYPSPQPSPLSSISSSDAPPSAIRWDSEPVVIYVTPTSSPSPASPPPALSTVSTVTPPVASDYNSAIDRGDLPNIFVRPSYPPIDTWLNAPPDVPPGPSTVSPAMPPTASPTMPAASGFSIAPPPAVSPPGAYDVPQGFLWSQFSGAAHDAADPNNPWWARGALFVLGSLASPISVAEEMFRSGINTVSNMGIGAGEHLGRASLWWSQGEYGKAFEDESFSVASESNAFDSAASILQPYTALAPRTPPSFELPADFLAEETPTATLPSHEVVPAIQYGKFADRGALNFTVPRTIYVYEGRAYYVSSGQARNLPGQIDKGVGNAFRIWGIQEQALGQLPEGWIGKQVFGLGDLVPAADTVQNNVLPQFEGILENPADVNAWLRSQGVPAFDSIPENWPP